MVELELFERQVADARYVLRIAHEKLPQSPCLRRFPIHRNAVGALEEPPVATGAQSDAAAFFLALTTLIEGPGVASAASDAKSSKSPLMLLREVGALGASTGPSLAALGLPYLSRPIILLRACQRSMRPFATVGQRTLTPSIVDRTTRGRPRTLTLQAKDLQHSKLSRIKCRSELDRAKAFYACSLKFEPSRLCTTGALPG